MYYLFLKLLPGVHNLGIWVFILDDLQIHDAFKLVAMVVQNGMVEWNKWNIGLNNLKHQFEKQTHVIFLSQGGTLVPLLISSDYQQQNVANTAGDNHVSLILAITGFLILDHQDDN